jgi:hypothetical protein
VCQPRLPRLRCLNRRIHERLDSQDPADVGLGSRRLNWSVSVVASSSRARESRRRPRDQVTITRALKDGRRAILAPDVAERPLRERSSPLSHASSARPERGIEGREDLETVLRQRLRESRAGQWGPHVSRTTKGALRVTCRRRWPIRNGSALAVRGILCPRSRASIASRTRPRRLGGAVRTREWDCVTAGIADHARRGSRLRRG